MNRKLLQYEIRCRQGITDDKSCELRLEQLVTVVVSSLENLFVDVPSYCAVVPLVGEQSRRRKYQKNQ